MSTPWGVRTARISHKTDSLCMQLLCTFNIITQSPVYSCLNSTHTDIFCLCWTQTRDTPIPNTHHVAIPLAVLKLESENMVNLSIKIANMDAISTRQRPWYIACRARPGVPLGKGTVKDFLKRRDRTINKSSEA